MKRNVVVTISHNKYKYVLLNKKYLRHSINRTQRKNHKIGSYEINKVYLSCFYDKIYIQNMWNISYLLVELIIKSSYLNHYLKRFFVKQIVLIFSVARTAFLSSILNLKNIKHLKNVSEELMHVARHQNKWLDWCVSEDKKKK